jgi:CsoR family transcriptional regulator, copper-sensing transcriptional repressor
MGRDRFCGSEFGAEGRIRGLQRMVEEDRYCAGICTQGSSAQEALRARALMRNHLSHCAAHAIRT